MKNSLKKLKILQSPHPTLRKVSAVIDSKKIDKKLKELADNMCYTMIENKGIGLAAPQVGKNIRLIVVNHQENPFPLVNPTISKASKSLVVGEEGCLSLPETFGSVKRCQNIECQYQDFQGRVLIMKANGLLARVIQHEIDHLDGILFTDKLEEIKK